MNLLSDVSIYGKLSVHVIDTDNSLTSALFISSNEVKTRTLGSMAFQDITSFYTKTESDNRFLQGLTLSFPSIFNPTTNSATPTSSSLNFSLSSQTKNYVFAAPVNFNGTPSFRPLDVLDIPDFSDIYVTIATAQTITGVKTFTPSPPVISTIAKGTLFTPNMTPLTNEDELIGVLINPTFNPIASTTSHAIMQRSLKVYGETYLVATGSTSTEYVLSTNNGFRIDCTGAVRIGTSAGRDPSVLLYLESNSRGFLLPRMFETQRTAIDTPVRGLQVYQTDNDEGIYVNLSTGWAKLLTSANLTGTFSSANFIFKEAIIPDGIASSFTLSYTGLVSGSEHIYYNGQLLDVGNDYTINSSTGVVTFTFVPPTTDKIRVSYIKN